MDMDDNDTVSDTVSNKSKLVCLLLWFFLFPLGAHRMYVGKITSGIMQLLFGFATLFIWNLVDGIFIIAGRFTDIDGKIVQQWITNE